MKIIDCEQRSPEWYAARLGKVTSSCFAGVLSNGEGRNTYMMELLAERTTGITQASYMNTAMQWGIDTEPQARAKYEKKTKTKVQQVGFIEYDENTGASTDGLVGEDGLIEIKCPNTSTHLTYILKDKMPAKYVPQVQGELWITGRKWCDFVSYDPRVKVNDYWCVRIERDEKKIAEIAEAVSQFVKELKELENKISPF